MVQALSFAEPSDPRVSECKQEENWPGSSDASEYEYK